LLPDPELFLKVVRGGFGPMDVLFLGIVLYQAWRIPAPASDALVPLAGRGR
jgi:hypothetical protein